MSLHVNTVTLLSKLIMTLGKEQIYFYNCWKENSKISKKEILWNIQDARWSKTTVTIHK